MQICSWNRNILNVAVWQLVGSKANGKSAAAAAAQRAV
jgi:hypothetical protein